MLLRPCIQRVSFVESLAHRAVFFCCSGKTGRVLESLSLCVTLQELSYEFNSFVVCLR